MILSKLNNHVLFFNPWDTTPVLAIVELSYLDLSSILIYDKIDFTYVPPITLDNIDNMLEILENQGIQRYYLDVADFPEELRNSAQTIKTRIIDKYVGTGLFILEDFSHPGCVLFLLKTEHQF